MSAASESAPVPYRDLPPDRPSGPFSHSTEFTRSTEPSQSTEAHSTDNAGSASPQESESFLDASFDSGEPNGETNGADNEGQFDLDNQVTPPPGASGKPPRQRRRRTSTEDQKILEAEFQKNPKPDRQTRLQIVSRVALGEKEVQIWFQNRRQSCRRRSRLAEAAQSIQVQTGGAPLYPFPHSEFTLPPSHLRQTTSLLQPSVPSSQIGDWQSGRHSLASPYTPGKNEISLRPGPNSGFAPPSLPLNSSLISNASSTSSSSSAEPASSFRPPTLTPSHSNVSVWSTGTAFSQASMSHFPQDGHHGSKTGYLANRRSASYTGQQHATPISHTLPDDRATRDGQDGSPIGSTVRRSANLRLSTTSDGKARVVDDREASMSPPRSSSRVLPQLGGSASYLGTRTPRSPTFRRAHSASVSAITPSSSPYARLPSSRRFSRTTSYTTGRAHDSRAWDYCCDPDIRNSLVNKADSEASDGARVRSTPKVLGYRDGCRMVSEQGAHPNVTPVRGHVVGDGSPISHQVRSSRRSPDGRGGLFGRDQSPKVVAGMTKLSEYSRAGGSGDRTVGLEPGLSERENPSPIFRLKSGFHRSSTFSTRATEPSPSSRRHVRSLTSTMPAPFAGVGAGPAGQASQQASQSQLRSGLGLGRDGEGTGLSAGRSRAATVGGGKVGPALGPLVGERTEAGKDEGAVAKRSLAPSEGEDGGSGGAERRELDGTLGSAPAAGRVPESRADVDMDCVEGLLKLSQGSWS